MLFGNFMFWKAVKHDCINLYFKMDKLSKKDCFKRFERVFCKEFEHSNKTTKIQEFKITKFQRYKNTRILF